MRPLHRATLPILTFACTGLLVLGAAHVIARAQSIIASAHAARAGLPAPVAADFALQRDRVARIAKWYANRYDAWHPEAQTLGEMVRAADAAFASGDPVMILWWCEQLRAVAPPAEMTS